MQATSYPTQPGVPGQAVYILQPAPVNYSTTVQNPNSSSGVSPNLNAAAGRATGWLQIGLGIGSIVVAIAQLVLETDVGHKGIGIWASVLFYIPTGILGVYTVKKKDTGVIIAYLTMSIIAAIVAFCQMIAGGIGAVFTNNVMCYGYRYSSHSHASCGLWEGRIASDSLLAILGLIEMIVAIVASAYCCGGMSCGNSSTRTTNVLYTQQATPMVVTNGQFTQPPQEIVQPPPAYNTQQAYPPTGQPVAPTPYNQAAAAPGYSQAAAATGCNQAAPAPNKTGGMVA